MKHLRRCFLGICIGTLVMTGGVRAQLTQLNLDSCQAMARRQYPLIRQYGLVKTAEELSIANVNKGFLPQLTLAGQATYQSDVTSIPFEIAGQRLEPLDKDQYRITLEVSQSLTDMTNLQDDKSIVRNQRQLSEAQMEVDFHRLAERLNNLYFSILLLTSQEKQLNVLRADIRLGLAKTAAAVDNGTALKTSLDLLQYELLKVEQRTIELQSSKGAYLRVLAGYIGQDVDENAVLEPPVVTDGGDAINRPELSLFNYRRLDYNLQQQSADNRKMPKLSWYVQAGYGRPGLNILNNSFDAFYIGGLRLSWNITTLYTMKNERRISEYRRRMIDVEQDVFVFNTDMTLRQHNADIEKYRKLIASDRQMIELREKIASITRSQLEQGVVTTTDYLQQINDADEARQNLAYHEVQLLMTIANKNITTGNQ